MPPVPVIAGYILLVLIWGSTWAAIKVGVTAVPPFVFAFERAVAVSVILTSLALVLRLPFPRGPRLLLVTFLVGIINSGSSWAIIFWSEQYVPSGLVAVFGAAGPIWTALLAHFVVRGDRLSLMKIVGLVFGIAGILVLVGSLDTGTRPEALAATALLAVMPISWAICTVLQLRILHQGSPIALVGVGTWAGAFVLLPLALLQWNEPTHWTPGAILAMAYLVIVGTCVGLVVQMWLTRHLRPTTMTLSQLLISTEALLVGAIALGETITLRMLAGAALVAIAIALNAIAGGGPRAQPAPVATPAD